MGIVFIGFGRASRDPDQRSQGVAEATPRTELCDGTCFQIFALKLTPTCKYLLSTPRPVTNPLLGTKFRLRVEISHVSRPESFQISR